MEVLYRLDTRVQLLAAGFLAPAVGALILVPFRNSLPNTSAALLLVLVVVGVASAGDRLAGLVGAVSAGLAFDFFLTRPYETFAIASAGDLQTTLLLLAVALAVTEIAHRGRMHQAMASARLGYLEGVESSAKVAADGSFSPSVLIERVSDQLGQVMGLTKCHFDYGTGLGYPRLDADGNIRWRDQIWDVDNGGLPANKDSALVVESAGRFMGRFLLKADARTHPTCTERLVAIALAAQVGAALRAYGDTQRHLPIPASQSPRRAGTLTSRRDLPRRRACRSPSPPSARLVAPSGGLVSVLVSFVVRLG